MTIVERETECEEVLARLFLSSIFLSSILVYRQSSFVDAGLQDVFLPVLVVHFLFMDAPSVRHTAGSHAPSLNGSLLSIKRVCLSDRIVVAWNMFLPLRSHCGQLDAWSSSSSSFSRAVNSDQYQLGMTSTFSIEVACTVLVSAA